MTSEIESEALPMMAPSEATQKLLGQFAGAGLFQELVESGQTRTETAAQITSIVATTFTRDIERPGEELAYLTDWHAQVQQDCTDRYAALTDTSPYLDRSTVRRDPELEMLNGVRQGVHRAMVRAQRSIVRRTRSS